MKAHKLPRSIYEAAQAAGVVEIRLEFSGGNDEGYLHIACRNAAGDYVPTLESEIDTWAWKVYSYSGAGEGSRYGDVITYDLNTMTIETSAWHQPTTDCDSEFEGGELQLDLQR